MGGDDDRGILYVVGVRMQLLRRVCINDEKESQSCGTAA